MRSIKKTTKIPSYRGTYFNLIDDLSHKGYFIRKNFDGWELCSIHKDDLYVHWSTTLRGLDEWINWKKIQLIVYKVPVGALFNINLTNREKQNGKNRK